MDRFISIKRQDEGRNSDQDGGNRILPPEPAPDSKEPLPEEFEP